MILHDTVSILIEQNGRILFIKRKYPPERNYWGMPGGHVDPGETPREAALREAREEVGPVRILHQKPYRFTHDVRIGHQHRAQTFRGVAVGTLRARSDAKSLGWFTFAQMRRMNVTNYTIHVLNALYHSQLSP